MKKEYDFKNAVKSPYAKKLKGKSRIKTSENSVGYFDASLLKETQKQITLLEKRVSKLEAKLKKSG